MFTDKYKIEYNLIENIIGLEKIRIIIELSIACKANIYNTYQSVKGSNMSKLGTYYYVAFIYSNNIIIGAFTIGFIDTKEFYGITTEYIYIKKEYRGRNITEQLLLYLSMLFVTNNLYYVILCDKIVEKIIKSNFILNIMYQKLPQMNKDGTFHFICGKGDEIRPVKRIFEFLNQINNANINATQTQIYNFYRKIKA